MITKSTITPQNCLMSHGHYMAYLYQYRDVKNEYTHKYWLKFQE